MDSHIYRLNPSYDHAMNNLANIYLVRGQYSEAEKLLKKCVQIRSGFAAAWMNLGLAMLGQRKFKVRISREMNSRS